MEKLLSKRGYSMNFNTYETLALAGFVLLLGYFLVKRISLLKNYNIIPVEEEIVIDNNLFTCSGPGNALDLSFRVLEKLTSKENLKIIQNNMYLK